MASRRSSLAPSDPTRRPRTGASTYQRRNDRQMRYAGRVVPPDRPIVISLDSDYARSYDGQVAGLVGANLLGRMTPNLIFHVPNAEIVPALPWSGCRLEHMMRSIAQ